MDKNKDEELSGEFILNNNEDENEPQPIKHSETASEKIKLESAPSSEANVTPQEKLAELKNLPNKKASFLSSFCTFPTNVHFENQEENEEIVLLIRRALITNIPWVLTSLLLIFLPIIVSISSDLITPFINISAKTSFVVLLFYYLGVFGFIIVQFMFWYFNVGLITGKRVVDLDLNGVLYKDVSETRLNLIEDVSYKKVGSIRAIFDYGDITLQTAGTLVNFEFDRAPSPAKIVRIIADMIGKKDK